MDKKSVELSASDWEKVMTILNEWTEAMDGEPNQQEYIDIIEQLKSQLTE